MLKDKQPVFIIGAPRSGSTWLHDILASHPEVASIDAELTVFSRYIAPLVKNYEIEVKPIEQGKWRQGLPLLWNRETFDKKITAWIDDIYSALTILPQHKIILDKHPDYSFHTDLINYYLPNAKFINIIRDGREVAYSWNRVAHEKGFGNPDFHGACMDWVRYKNSAREAQKFGNTNYLEVRYEALMHNINDELLRILSFCGLSTAAGILKEIISTNVGERSMTSVPDPRISYADRKSGEALWKKRLTKEQQYICKQTLGKELINEGYEKDTNWGLSKSEESLFSIKARLRHYWNILRKK